MLFGAKLFNSELASSVLVVLSVRRIMPTALVANLGADNSGKSTANATLLMPANKTPSPILSPGYNLPKSDCDTPAIALRLSYSFALFDYAGHDGFAS